jgi:hypothetical protein
MKTPIDSDADQRLAPVDWYATVQRVGRMTGKDVAEAIAAIATMMWGTAERMEYFGGFKGEMRQHAHELAGAATIARGWAKAIRARRHNDQDDSQSPAKNL